MQLGKRQRGKTHPAFKHAATLHVGVWEVSGRPVGKTIADPDVEQEVRSLTDQLRKDRKALLDSYIEQGMLTRDGKLTKQFGG